MEIFWETTSTTVKGLGTRVKDVVNGASAVKMMDVTDVATTNGHVTGCWDIDVNS